MEEAQIIKSITRGDMTNFEYIVNSYERTVFGFIYRMIHNTQTAEDLTQEVFIKVFKNIYKFNTNYPFIPWVLKIAYNTTINYIKGNKRTIAELPFIEEFQNEYYIDKNINNIEVKSVIQQAVSSLKPDYRAIFIMRMMEDLTFEHIAEILETTTASVKLKFYRSKEDIIKKLSNSFKEV